MTVSKNKMKPFPLNLIYNPALINKVDRQIDLRYAAKDAGYGAIIESGRKFLARHPKTIIPTNGGIVIVFNTPLMLIGGINPFCSV